VPCLAWASGGPWSSCPGDTSPRAVGYRDHPTALLVQRLGEQRVSRLSDTVSAITCVPDRSSEALRNEQQVAGRDAHNLRTASRPATPCTPSGGGGSTGTAGTSGGGGSGAITAMATTSEIS